MFIIVSLGFEYSLRILDQSDRILHEFMQTITNMIKVNILTVENTRNKLFTAQLKEEISSIIIFNISTLFTLYNSNRQSQLLKAQLQDIGQFLVLTLFKVKEINASLNTSESATIPKLNQILVKIFEEVLQNQQGQQIITKNQYQ